VTTQWKGPPGRHPTAGVSQYVGIDQSGLRRDERCMSGPGSFFSTLGPLSHWAR
jgi:hypothetical protein